MRCEAIIQPLSLVVSSLLHRLPIVSVPLVLLFGPLLGVQVEGLPYFLRVRNVLRLLEQPVKRSHPHRSNDQVDVLVVDPGSKSLDGQPLIWIIQLGMDVTESLGITPH